MSFRDRLVFALYGSLIDLIGKAIPNYERPSPLWLEKEVGGELALSKIEAHHPAFLDNGTIYLESSSLNEITFNTNLDLAFWIKGDNFAVVKDEARIPSSRNYGDRAIVAGDPTQAVARNTMYRGFALEPHTDYTYSVMLRHWGGEFRSSDNIRITRQVLDAETINLEELNDFPQKYQIKSASFTTGGTKNIEAYSVLEWEIVNIVGNTYTLELISPSNIIIEAGELEISRLLVEDSGFFTIADNTAKGVNDNQIDIIIDDYGDLTAPVLNDIVSIVDARKVYVQVEFTCQSAAVFDVAMQKIEPNGYRTSPNFQFNTVDTTADCRLYYEKSPIAGLDNFALLIEVEFWRGRVNLFITKNLEIWIDENKDLIVNADGGVFRYPNMPNKFVLGVNCVAYKSQLQIYLNQQLIKIYNIKFTGDLNSRLGLSIDRGVLALKRLICTSSYLKDGDINTLDFAASEVKEWLSATDLIKTNAVGSKLTDLTLPQVLIPAATNPEAQAFIVSLNTVTKTLLVDDTAGLAIGDIVYAVRYLDTTEVRRVIKTKVVNVDADSNLIRLESVFGVQQEDYLIKGRIAEPGMASVRFPYTPIDNQIIEGIDYNTSELSLSSVTAFTRGRAFVRDNNYRAIAEVDVIRVDNGNRRIKVSDLAKIKTNHIICQPQFETEISPSNYFAKLTEEVDRVKIVHQYKNGLLLENYNPYPIRVTPLLILAL